MCGNTFSNSPKVVTIYCTQHARKIIFYLAGYNPEYLANNNVVEAEVNPSAGDPCSVLVSFYTELLAEQPDGCSPTPTLLCRMTSKLQYLTLQQIAKLTSCNQQ